MQHVLPKGFHKIRHVGLYACADKRDRARLLVGALSMPAIKPTWRELLLSVTGRDVSVCPRCSSRLVSKPLPRGRDPPEAAA